MVVGVSYVQLRREEKSFNAFELTVALHSGHVETARLVERKNGFGFVCQCFLFSVLDGGNCAETDPFGDGVKKRVAVDKKNVNKQSELVFF